MKYLFFIFSYLYYFVPAYSQNTVPEILTSGGDYLTNNYASMSITLGEVATETISNSNNKLTQGFQQANMFTSSILKTEVNSSYFQVYPNPTNGDIFVHLNNQNIIPVIIYIADLTGKIILEEKCESFENNKKLSLLNLAMGSYFITIQAIGVNAIKETFLITKVY